MATSHILKKIFSGFVFTSLVVVLSTGLSADDRHFQQASDPAVPRGPSGAWDGRFIDPGATVVHDGMFHMFYAAIHTWPHPLSIGHATSEDGYNWERQSSEPVVDGDGTYLEGRSLMSNSAVVLDDGTWALYFTAVQQGKNFTGSIAMATAPSPDGPWIIDPALVLEPGAEGEWDEIAIGNASVVKADDGYRMYYTGSGNYQNGAFIEEHEYVGLATSLDGSSWSKYNDPSTEQVRVASSDPVFITNTIEDAWDSWAISDTGVQRTSDGWLMVYRGAAFSSSGNVGLAESADGINWVRVREYPIIQSATVGKKVYFTSYVRHDGTDFVFFEAGSPSGTDVLVSTAPVNYMN